MWSPLQKNIKFRVGNYWHKKLLPFDFQKIEQNFAFFATPCMTNALSDPRSTIQKTKRWVTFCHTKKIWLGSLWAKNFFCYIRKCLKSQKTAATLTFNDLYIRKKNFHKKYFPIFHLGTSTTFCENFKKIKNMLYHHLSDSLVQWLLNIHTHTHTHNVISNTILS